MKTKNRSQQYLTLFQGKRGWDREARTYEPKDDGVHIEDSTDQWEWWYFDFSFDNGYKAVATLHYRNMMMLPHIPTMELFVYPPDGPPKAKLWALRPGQEKFADKDRCLVRMANLSIEDTGEAYHLKMDMKDMGIDLTLKNVIRPWKPGTGILWSDSEKGLETGWVVAVPRGWAEGTLKVDGQVMKVQGLGYHDHNWGNAPMEKPFRGWYWGHLFDPTYTLIYGWIIPREGRMPVVSPFMLAKGLEIVVSTDRLSITVEEEKREKRYGFGIPIRLRIRCVGQGVDLDSLLTTERLVEALELPRGGSAFHYYRFLASYKAAIEVDGVKEEVLGETFHEMMVLE
jgi:hypothetical protein